MATIDIKYSDKYGDSYNRLRDIPITESAKVVASLMESEYIELPFVSEKPVFFEIGDYVDLSNEKYDDLRLFRSLRKKYVVRSKQVPTYNPSTGVYEYRLRLDAYYWQWNNRVFKFRPFEFGQEASWGITGGVSSVMTAFIDNLEAYGFGIFDFKLDKDYNINVNFDGTLMIDALNAVVNAINEAYKTNVEWWVEENRDYHTGGDHTNTLAFIHIGECKDANTSSIVVTDEGDFKNAESITPKDAEQEYSNRIIAFGSTQNITPRYRKELWFNADIVDGDIIEDATHTQLSLEWFKSDQVEYEQADKRDVSFNAERDMRNTIYTASWNVDICEKKFTSSSQSIEFDIAFGKMSASGFGDIGNIDQFDQDIEGGGKFYLKWNEVDIQLIAISDKTKEDGSIDSQEYMMRHVSFKRNKSDNITDPSSLIKIKGTWNPGEVNTDFVDSDKWRFLMRVDVKINPPYADGGHGNVNDPNYKIEINSRSGSFISFVDEYAYRVRTHIKKKNGQEGWCTINPDFHDASSPEARKIKLHDYVIEQGDLFEFPDIVKGRVPAGYFVSTSTDETNVNSVVQRNLMLPLNYMVRYEKGGKVSVATADGSDVKKYNNVNYVDASLDDKGSNVVERIIVFDEIFPRMKNTSIRKVGYYEQKTKEEENTVQTIIDEDGELVRKHRFFQFTVDNFPFNKECLIPGTELKIHFQTGKLAGMTFGVGFNPGRVASVFPDSQKFDEKENRYEIVANEDYGIELPNELAYPESGDQFILSGWNVEAMEGNNSLIALAEQELLEETVKVVERLYHDPHTYEAKMLSDDMYRRLSDDVDDENKFDFALGTVATVKNTFLFPSDRDNERKLRVIGYEVKLDIPYDSPRLTIGESMEYSTLKALKSGSAKSEQSMSVYGGAAGAGGGGGASLTEIIARLKPRFISKIEDDIANGFIRFIKGLWAKEAQFGKLSGKQVRITEDGNIETSDYSQGALGAGATLGRYGDTEDSYLEVDRMLVRKVAYFVELMIEKLSHVGGQIILTPCSMVASDVSYNSQSKVYRCYFNAKDGEKTITNDWKVGDLARCQTFNIKEGTSQNAGNSYYWREVVGVGTDENRGHWIDLSDEEGKCDAGSTEPKNGDNIVQMGNRTDKTRQNAILLSAFGGDAPAIKKYHGIDSFSLVGKEVTFDGIDEAGNALFRVFGNFYFGDKEESNYVKYSQEEGLEVLANKIYIKTKEGDEKKSLTEIVDQFGIDLETIKNQNDQNYVIWFYPYDPTNSNEPAVNWTTDEMRAEHEQDLFYNEAAGTAWRYIGGNWVEITDKQTVMALQKVKEKKRVFVGGEYNIPNPPYDEGDLWVNAYWEENGKKVYENDILKCRRSKEEGETFEISDWVAASAATKARLDILQNEITAIVESEDGLLAQMQIKVDEAQAQAILSAGYSSEAKNAAKTAAEDAAKKAAAETKASLQLIADDAKASAGLSASYSSDASDAKDGAELAKQGAEKAKEGAEKAYKDSVGIQTNIGNIQVDVNNTHSAISTIAGTVNGDKAAAEKAMQDAIAAATNALANGEKGGLAAAKAWVENTGEDGAVSMIFNYSDGKNSFLELVAKNIDLYGKVSFNNLSETSKANCYIDNNVMHFGYKGFSDSTNIGAGDIDVLGGGGEVQILPGSIEVIGGTNMTYIDSSQIQVNSLKLNGYEIVISTSPPSSSTSSKTITIVTG